MKFKNLYCNGCSTMCGGGLEVVHKDLLKYYEDRYGLKWNSERDIMWPKLVADNLQLNIHDFSKSGAGIERYIRETYDYIYEDFKRAEETIFFIELPVIWNKVDIWSNPHKRYLICNIDLVDNPIYESDGYVKGAFRDLHLCDDYFYQSEKERKEIENELAPALRESFKKSWATKQYEKKIIKNLIGLLGYMKYKKYTFYILPSAINLGYIQQFIPDIYDNILLFSDVDDSELHINWDFHNWASKNDMKITNETDGKFVDTHPGYFAHVKWAEMVTKFLKEKYYDEKTI